MIRSLEATAPEGFPTTVQPQKIFVMRYKVVVEFGAFHNLVLHVGGH
jgi:hypothetical protein